MQNKKGILAVNARAYDQVLEVVRAVAQAEGFFKD